MAKQKGNHFDSIDYALQAANHQILLVTAEKVATNAVNCLPHARMKCAAPKNCPRHEAIYTRLRVNWHHPRRWGGYRAVKSETTGPTLRWMPPVCAHTLSRDRGFDNQIGICLSAIPTQNNGCLTRQELSTANGWSLNSESISLISTKAQISTFK